jgi:hypothetical protein
LRNTKIKEKEGEMKVKINRRRGNRRMGGGRQGEKKKKVNKQKERRKYG